MTDKESYPTIPERQWWSLRNKFKQTIPAQVTPGYLAGVLNMSEKSAKTNILPALISLGIIDTEGKQKERAILWRDDESYPNVCKEIIEEVYPQDLISAFPPPDAKRESVKRFIAQRIGVGDNAASKMASLYILLCKADPRKGQDVQLPSTRIKQEDKSTQNLKKSTEIEKAKREEKKSSPLPKTAVGINRAIPSIHIDIQIHISPDTTSTQIDQIFDSMARHLGKLISSTNE